MKRFNIVALIITFVWLASMGALVTKHYGSFEEPAVREAPPDWLFEESWMGIYQGANKIGYTVSKLDPLEDGYRATASSIMNITVMGFKKEIKTSIDALLDEGFRLRSFLFSLASDVSITVEGSVEGKEMLMALDMNGVKTEKRIHLDELPYLSPDIAPLLEDPTLGKRLRFPIVSPASMSTGYVELEVLGKEEITVMGVRREAFKITGDFMGADFAIWSDAEGQVLRQEAMGFTYLKESEEEAKAVGSASMDLIAEVAVPVDTYIPEDVRYLKLRLEGVDTGKFELDGGVQTLEYGDTVEIKIPSLIRSAPLPEGLDEYLNETLMVESADPSIVSLAEEIVADEKDPVHRARLISEWVHANVAKVPTMTLPSALDVLKTRRGDCNEHTALYTALARAAGVPTRIAVGLVHKDGHFYYHAWPEVYLDGWVPIDPTLGQFPADATHLRLLTGGLENQLRIGSAIGKLRITVLDYKL